MESSRTVGVVLLAGALLLVGCANMAPGSTAEAQYSSDPAIAYMQRIEQTARANGVDVVWINPPARRDYRAE